MNLKRIKAFILLVEHKSFSAVAQLLSISQPAVSNQIKALEQDLGLVLINRETAEPSEAGRRVYRRGKKLIEEWDRLVHECDQLQEHLTGQLRIGASTIPGSWLVPAVLKRFRQQFPKVEVSLCVQQSMEVLQQISNGTLDLGIVGILPEDERFISQLTAQDHLVMIGPPNTEDVDLSEHLADKPFIFRSESSGTWQAAKKGYHQWSSGGVLNDLYCVAKVDTTESVISLVEAGLGYSIVSSYAAHGASKQSRIKVLAHLPLKRNFYICFLKEKNQPTAALELVHLFKEAHLGIEE